MSILITIVVVITLLQPSRMVHVLLRNPTFPLDGLFFFFQNVCSPLLSKVVYLSSFQVCVLSFRTCILVFLHLSYICLNHVHFPDTLIYPVLEKPLIIVRKVISCFQFYAPYKLPIFHFRR